MDDNGMHSCIQVAQLSQRGRTMLSVIEYFAMSLKITQVIRS